MNKLSLMIIFFLLSVIIFGAYKFIYQGNVVTAVDGRTALVLTATEKDLILEEMRGFLSAAQQIVQAVSNDEMDKIVVAAKKVGKAAQAEVPASLIGKLPMAFKKLGFDTHVKFDELAMDAQDMEDKEQSLKLLGQLMQNCVACHAAYRLDLETE